MNVVEKRFKGKLSELRPLVRKIPPSRVKEIVNEVFCIEFIEPMPAHPFVYVCKQKIKWYIRPEERNGTKKEYWVMRKTIGGNRVTKYLAPVGELTLDILQEKSAEALEKIQ